MQKKVYEHNNYSNRLPVKNRLSLVLLWLLADGFQLVRVKKCGLKKIHDIYQ
ncbi:hypothetical protein HMPREF0454_00506 [Hafnia alvei ATCC 51873]|uniref:Uncharacterized protein n=1 Tax=Hafnia alvei ATCC 51873 TaxID=1002364 RepID=G9Y1T8_HAFAL|nr:hypothetical protein HMPREF0454_00506 [Hafnia alvei ATCC 51873]